MENQSKSTLMLRELQKLVTDERSAKEKLEIELQSVKDSLKALQLAGTYNAEYEKRVRDLVSFLYLEIPATIITTSGTSVRILILWVLSVKVEIV